MIDSYETFKKHILLKTGIDLSCYKEKQMKRRIDTLIKRSNQEKYSDYLTLLDKSSSHLKEFLNYITINVSDFFRNPSQWATLKSKILPFLFKRKSRLKIWSAACSTGEEPYTIAMILAKINMLKNVDILATDIDDQVLKIAQKGLYNEKSLSTILEGYKHKFFKQSHSNYYLIDPQLKQSISFKKLDLLKDKFPQNCDLIICRNVLIYFTEKTKNDIYHKFHSSLSSNGVLFVGNTEQIILPQKYGFSVLEHFFYTKINNPDL